MLGLPSLLHRLRHVPSLPPVGRRQHGLLRPGPKARPIGRRWVASLLGVPTRESDRRRTAFPTSRPSAVVRPTTSAWLRRGGPPVRIGAGRSRRPCSRRAPSRSGRPDRAADRTGLGSLGRPGDL